MVNTKLMITLKQIDFREIELPKDKRVLSITDPPYNIKFKYGAYKDNLSEKEYIDMLSHIPKPCVIINYPEETLNYVIPAMGCNPDKVLFWCYNSHLPRAVRMISFFGIKPNLSKYKIPYRNPNDKRVKKLIDNGSEGTSLKEWFVIEQVKNVSKEYQGYANQIPEELIRIILSLSEGQFDTVFDPFCGSGTTLVVGIEKGYEVIGTDIDSNAISISKKRLGVKSGCDANDDGIPSKTKVLGIYLLFKLNFIYTILFWIIFICSRCALGYCNNNNNLQTILLGVIIGGVLSISTAIIICDDF